MKPKILIACLIALSAALFAPGAKAQTVMHGDNGLPVDTLRNAVTEHLTSPQLGSIGLAGKYDLQMVITNDSATTSVVAILEGSLDGTNWDRVYKTPGNDGIACDSITFTGSKVHTWHIQPNQAKTYLAAPYANTAGRRLYLRVTLIHAAGGRTRYSGKLITSE